MGEARYLEDHGDRLVVRPCADDALAHGALAAFALAPLVTASASAAAFWVAEDDVSFLSGWGAGAAAAALLALYGIARMVTARPRARRGVVTIDLSERVLERADRTVEVLRDVAAVRVRRGRLALALELAHGDGRATPLLRAPRSEGRALAEAADHLADALGTEAEVPAAARRARPLIPRDPRLASALCYAPIDGLFVAASLYYMATSRDPFVRFSAKQSLALFALSLLSLPLFVGCCGLPFASIVPRDLVTAAVGSSVILWIGARVAARTMAAMRAHRGIVWIQPWLSPIARWLGPPARS